MKKLLIFTLLSIIFLTNVYSQWTNQNPVPDGNDLWSTFFVNDSTGWIVGSEGFIKKTTNSGLDWIQQNSSTNQILKSVQFVSENTGWICGESGLILKTTDGGQNWLNQTSGTTEHLTSINFCDLYNGYIVGFGGTILKTTNGGLTWFSQSSGTSCDIYDLDFVDTLVGYAVGGEYGSYAILKTTDGGSSWINKGSGFYYYYLFLLTVEFIDINTGFIGGGYSYQNIIFKTTDGGETWFDIALSTNGLRKEQNHDEQTMIYKSGGINSIYFDNSMIGYAVGGNGYGWDRKIFTTSDGGSTWNRKYIGWEENGLISVFGKSNGQALAVGFTGTIFTTENYGNSWQQILSGNRLSCSSGDDLYSVFCISENVGWAVGYRASCLGGGGNIVLKTTNGGRIWKTQLIDQHQGGQVKSVHFVDEYFGWAVGEGTTGLYRTTDGGENWIESDVLFSSVFFEDHYTGWATKDYFDKGIYKSTDGGISWLQKCQSSSSSVYFSDIVTGWAVGEGGIILKSSDGGETWIIKTSSNTNDLNCVKFYDSTLGMCVGNEGTVLLSTDGGESWISRFSGTHNNLEAITFINSNSVWIAGSNGTILNSTDLGITWISYNEVTENNLTSVCFANENTGWFGGMNGTMLKYQNNFIPVELISFTLTLLDNNVRLDWSTATESNNTGFEIQRQESSKQPEAGDWEVIDLIPGFGTTTEPKSYSFIDENIPAGVYKYRLKQIDFDGSFIYSDEREVLMNFTPKQFVLYQNYPNPFNPITTIKFAIPKESDVNLSIYNVLGELVTTLVNEQMKAGYYDYEFSTIDGSVSNGDVFNLASGVYLYTIKAGDFVESKKMILIK
ncbi:MAG: YCF48-related protein [Ignavibacteriaceae bacterium]|nr:YCF48-related protein [Ignavibacteriaceae bacterium]